MGRTQRSRSARLASYFAAGDRDRAVGPRVAHARDRGTRPPSPLLQSRQTQTVVTSACQAAHGRRDQSRRRRRGACPAAAGGVGRSQSALPCQASSTRLTRFAGCRRRLPRGTPATRIARKTRAPSAGTPSPPPSAGGIDQLRPASQWKIAIIALITAPLRAAAGHAAPSAAAWPTLPAGPRTPAAPAAHRRSGQSPTAPTGTPRHTGPAHVPAATGPLPSSAAPP